VHRRQACAGGHGGERDASCDVRRGSNQTGQLPDGEACYRTDDGVVSAELQSSQYLRGVVGQQADHHHVAAVHDLLVIRRHPHGGEPGREFSRTFGVSGGGESMIDGGSAAPSQSPLTIAVAIDPTPSTPYEVTG
jgi:hypothetical protein